MRKPVVPRFLLLLVLYSAIFITLVYIQFNKKTNFTLRTGNLVVQGNYFGSVKQTSNTYRLSGKASVFFGGMEFILGEGLELAGFSGPAGIPTLPMAMTIEDNEASFRLKEGPWLFFTTQYTGGAIELVIRVDFFDTIYSSLKIPYKALPTSIVRKKDQQLLLNVEGTNYSFSRNTGTDSIVLETQNPAIGYRVIPDKETINPRDFIIQEALDSEKYEAALALWLDQAYMLWNRTAAGTRDNLSGELICAYLNEALNRGTYKAAAAAVNALWNPSNVFYEASPYIGRLDAALRNLSTSERERGARLARLFNEKSSDFLKEFHIIEYLAIRGYDTLMDDAAEILRRFDPASMTPEQAAGILEGRDDWRRYRPGRLNPFDRFADQALFVISGSLRKNQRKSESLVFSKGSAAEEADIELNLRLGKILQEEDDEIKNALGRTLILSVLSHADGNRAVPRTLRSNFIADSERIDSQSVYRICFAGKNYARSRFAAPGIWAWTAASAITGDVGAGKIDLSVEFPAGETHYMIIRGIKPFTTLQLNNINYNQDSQFERYDYSGWTYSGAEQTLLIKIRHRLPVEKITILF